MLRILPAGGSRHDSNGKFEPSRLMSDACMIEFLVSEADEDTTCPVHRYCRMEILSESTDCLIGVVMQEIKSV